MARQTNEERLVALEVKLDTLLTTVGRIDARLGASEQRYITKEKHQDDLKDILREIDINRKKLARVWIQNTLSALLGSVMTFLIINYLSGGI